MVDNGSYLTYCVYIPLRFNSFFSLSLMFKQILSFSFDVIMYFDDSIGYILSNISDLCQSKTFWWVNIYLTLVSIVKTSYYFGDNFIFRMPCTVLRLCVYTSCVFWNLYSKQQALKHMSNFDSLNCTSLLAWREHNWLGFTPHEMEVTSLNLLFPLSLLPKVKTYLTYRSSWVDPHFG